MTTEAQLSPSATANGERRVVLISEALLGGVREHILRLAFSLKERGWDVRLVVALERADPGFHAELPHLQAAGIPVYPLPMSRNIAAPGNLIAMVRLALLLRKWMPAVVHTHCAIAGAVGRVAALVAGSRAIIYSPHGGSLHQVYGLWGKLYGALERMLAVPTKTIILISEWLRSRCIEVVGCAPEKMVVVPIGIELEQFPPISAEQRKDARAALGVSPETSLFVCIGVLRPIKGQDLLVSAFRHVYQRHPKARLFVVGQGEMRGQLEELARRFNISEAVRFTGFVDDITPYLRAADVYVQPSRSDASSYSSMEAMASSLPVVATRVAALPEIIQDGVTGFLADIEDEQAMAAAMSFLADSPEQRQKMGMAGRRRIVECFRAEEMVRQTEGVYLNCLQTAVPEPCLPGFND